MTRAPLVLMGPLDTCTTISWPSLRTSRIAFGARCWRCGRGSRRRPPPDFAAGLPVSGLPVSRSVSAVAAPSSPLDSDASPPSSSRSSSSPGMRVRNSLSESASSTCRNAARSSPMSTNAAFIPGSTRVTFPRYTSPTTFRSPRRSMCSSVTMPPSMRATRVSPMSTLMTIWLPVMDRKPKAVRAAPECAAAKAGGYSEGGGMEGPNVARGAGRDQLQVKIDSISSRTESSVRVRAMASSFTTRPRAFSSMRFSPKDRDFSVFSRYRSRSTSATS